jgi:hypothetical protein
MQHVQNGLKIEAQRAAEEPRITRELLLAERRKPPGFFDGNTERLAPCRQK